jgi:hypothetical protein
MATKFKTLLWFALLAAVIAGFSLYVVWLGDDIDYSYYIHDNIWNSNGSIDSVGEFFASQGNHYLNVNGRFVAHALVQLFCATLGKTAFALANALVYCAFVYAVLKLCGVRRVLQSPGAVITCTTVALLTFVTKMMPTTQIGFVWMFTVNMLWLRLFLHNRRRSAVQTVLICVLGLIAGNGQEALTLGLSAALGLWWLHKRCRVGAARTAMLLCYWAGTLAICCSPGTLGRAGGMSITFSSSVIYLLFSLRATYMLIIALAVLRARRRISLAAVYRQNALLLNTMAVMLVFNLFIGVYCNRQLFGIELMAMLTLLRVLPRRAFAPWLNAVAVVAVAAMMVPQARGAADIRRQYDAIHALYVDAPKGIVYFDRTLASNNYFMREYRYYEEIIGQFNSDTHHSLQKLLHVNHPKLRALHVWPTYIQQLTSMTDTIIEYAPQHYFITSLDAKPSTPTLYSRGNTSVLTIEKSAVTGRGWHSMIVVPHTPFAPIDSIR